MEGVDFSLLIFFIYWFLEDIYFEWRFWIIWLWEYSYEDVIKR